MAKSGQILCGYRSAPGGPRRLDLSGPARRPPLTQRPGYELLVATVAALRKSAPCAYPVVVRSGGVPDTMDGFCIRRKRRFVIHLGECLSPTNAVAVLVHEWAHARAWTTAWTGPPGMSPREEFRHGNLMRSAMAPRLESSTPIAGACSQARCCRRFNKPGRGDVGAGFLFVGNSTSRAQVGEIRGCMGSRVQVAGPFARDCT